LIKLGKTPAAARAHTEMQKDVANFKRKRCRYKGSRHMSYVSWMKRIGLEITNMDRTWARRIGVEGTSDSLTFRCRRLPGWANGPWYPRAHDILFHVKPERRRWQKLAHRIKRGADPDNVPHLLRHKPHKYYW
jgi:hypothetical protein